MHLSPDSVTPRSSGAGQKEAAGGLGAPGSRRVHCARDGPRAGNQRQPMVRCRQAAQMGVVFVLYWSEGDVALLPASSMLASVADAEQSIL